MHSEPLEEKIRGVMTKVSVLDPSDQQTELMEEIRKELKELYAEILEIPSEPDRNELWDQIIRVFQDIQIIAGAVKAIADLWPS